MTEIILAAKRCRQLLRSSLFMRILFVQLAACLLLDIAMAVSGFGNNINNLRRVYRMWGWGDSWIPIGNAMQYAATHTDLSGLYQATYFQSQFQFIYSPQSLALFTCLQSLGLDFGHIESATRASWTLLLVLVVIALVLYAMLGNLIRLPEADRRLRVLMVPVAICSVYLFYPLTFGYKVGNIQNFLTALTAIAMLCLLKDRSGLAGTLFGIAVLVKPHVGLLALWALLRRDWRFVAGMAGAGVIGTLLSLTMYGWPIHQAYLELLGYLSGRGESYHASHSIESAFYRMIQVGNNLQWDGTHTQLKPIAWIHGLASILGLAVIAFAFRPRTGNTPELRMIDFGVAVLAVVIASPVAYEHHFGIAYLLAPGALLIALARPIRDPLTMGLLVAGYVCIGGIFSPTDLTADTPFNILQSYRLFGALMLIAGLLRLRREIVLYEADEPPPAAGAKVSDTRMPETLAPADT